MRFGCIGLAVLCSVLASSLGWAQDAFTHSVLRVGDRVEVIRTSGPPVRGTVRGVEPFALTVGEKTIPFEAGLRVDRRGDPLWNGFVVGMVTGATLGATIDRTGCFHGATLQCVLGPAAIFGALGAWFDHGHQRRTTVFVATPTTVDVRPVISRAVQALSVRVSF